MAYSDSVGDNAVLLKRTLAHVADFSGRSRRTEVIYYWIATALIGATLNFAADMFLSFEVSFVFHEALQLFLCIPYFALFARRLHDQGRSAWWTLMLPLVIAVGTYDRLRVTFHGFDPAWPDLGWWKLVLALPVLLSLAFMFMPGDEGDNRFGPDPRLGEPEPSVA
jgi:uncharacterized membrane protein YhaH (DUF805 family)